MDLKQVFADAALKQEFLDRVDEFADAMRVDSAMLEGLEGGPAVDDVASVAESMSDGSYMSGSEPGIEAIVERFTRPVYLVQQSTFAPPADRFPNSEEIHLQLDGARHALEQVIPSTGRVDLRNHRLDWVGTGWMVAPGIVVTNRHVAREFAVERNGGFAFAQTFGLPLVRATIDWRHEYLQPDESRFRVEEILWIEPVGSVDLALLRVSDAGEDGERAPQPIELMSREEVDGTPIGSWISVIGYPAHDSRNDEADQQRIFDGIYNVKRLAPGKVTAVVEETLLAHDATTLGGNSGSVVVDLYSGKALALHFGGVKGERNLAVQAPRVQLALDPYLT